MSFQGQGAYSSNAGIANVNYILIMDRDPTTNDVYGDKGVYPFGTQWLNQSTRVTWQLFSFNSSSNTLTANWESLGGRTGDVNTLTGDSGGAVSPDTVGNINILGTSNQIVVTGTPVNNTLTLSLAGGTNASLSPYIVGTTGPCDYSTIQAAINQAVSDGASSSNPKNIYVKPGTYTENITVADGINIIGFVPAGSIDADELNSSFLNGTVTHASGTVTFSNFGFSKSTGNIYNMQAGVVGLFGSSITYSSNVFWVLTTAAVKHIDVENTNYVVTGTGQYASVDNSAMTAIFHSENSFYEFSTTTTITSTNAFFIQNFNNDIVTNSFVLNCPTWILHLDDCQFSPNAGSAVVASGANTTNGDLLIHACDVAVNDGGTFLNFSAGSGVTWQVTWSTVQSFTTPWSNNISAANALNQGSYYLNASSAQNTTVVFGTEITGYRGSEWNLKQGMVQTANATPTTIATIAVPALGTTTVKGTISGQTATATDATCGDFLVAARNPAGTAILANIPIVNVMATSTGTFTALVSGGNIIIQVTGIAATTINWVTTYSFHSTLLNT